MKMDRTTLHGVLHQIDADITGRIWLIEGRGAHEWDDDRYRQDFWLAVNSLQEKLEALKRFASDLTESPTTQEDAPAQQPSSTSGDGPCGACGAPCECWFTDSELWNRVNGSASGLLCLRCFVAKAEAMGINRQAWKLGCEFGA